MGYQEGNANLLDDIVGVNKGKATPNLLEILPDSDTAAAVARAEEEYQASLAAARERAKASAAAAAAPGTSFADQLKHLRETISTVAQPPPPVDVGALQAQQDRDRLLKLAMNAYQPAIADLLSASRGEGPSAALNYYREAADNATRRIMGDAASMRGTGGQRSALYRDAMGQASDARMQAANKAAIVGAEEQNQARASLNATLSGLTNLYGNILYPGTEHARDANVAAANRADDINAGIAASNTKNKSDFIGDTLETTGRGVAAASTGGASEGVRALGNLPPKK